MSFVRRQLPIPNPTLTGIVASEKAKYARDQAIFDNMIVECAGMIGKRENIIERLLAGLPSAQDK